MIPQEAITWEKKEESETTGLSGKKVGIIMVLNSLPISDRGGWFGVFLDPDRASVF